MTLRDCPFCGEPNPIMWGDGGSLGRTVWRLCNECGAQGPRITIHRNETDEDAIANADEAWNERMPDAPLG